MTERQIIVIAGPNGAGKTTFALRHLRGEAPGVHFVNADLIAAGLSPLDAGAGVAVAAGRMMLAEIDRLAAEDHSFAFETTLAGRGYLRRIDRWRLDGYRVSLLFLSLGCADEAVRRVEQRVGNGGHWVPESVIRRRFESGLQNLRDHYAARVDAWRLYDNSGPAPALLDEGGVSTDRGQIDVVLGREFDEAVLRSLRLAAKDAHLLAYQTGTGVVTWRDGKAVVVPPDPAMYEDLIPPPFQEGDAVHD